MKKLLILSLSLFFSLTTVGHAVQYPLEVAVTDTDMTVTLSGATGQTTPLLILAQTAPFQGNAVDYAQNNGIVRFLDEGIGRPSPFDRTRQPNSSGVAVWKFSTLPNTTYYIRIYNVTNIANPQLVTETKTVTTPKVTSFYGASLAITTNGQQASFAGKVDTSRYGTVAPMRITLEYALDKDFAQKQITQSTKTKGGAIEGVSDDGTYYFELSGLTPKQLYFFRQIVQIGGTTITVPGDSFRAGETYVPSGSVEATVNDNVYNLLAPWPNFTKLMDPGMCAQQKAQGTLPANAVCDVNGFINFAFKTLIGLTAVMLVLRLVYEGYKYVVTDVPFLKANAKSEFGTALVGLLIALSAYTIFNTINPKLVSNTISIDQVAVGVEYSIVDPATYERITGQPIKAKAEYVDMVDRISQQRGIDACIVKATITIESNWKPNVIGCDENVRSGDVPSRTAFVGSGIKLDGTVFSDNSATNNCPKNINSSVSGYGLDWRFSKGGGLMQKTLFPPGYNTQAWFSGVKKDGAYWNSRNTPFSGWQTLLVPESNINSGIDILQTALQKCGNSVNSAFRLYQAGTGRACNFSSDLVNKTVAKKMTEYQLCKNNPSKYAR